MLTRFLRSPLAVPVLMAFVILAIGAQVACANKIPSWSNDEPAHLGYIATLAQGHLPTIDSPIVADPASFGPLADQVQGWDPAHTEIWTANHPPLYHIALVPLWWLLSGNPGAMVVTMRLVNTIGFALWVLLVGVVARDLFPRRPAVPALAAVIAVTPTLSIRSGYLMNDGFSGVATLLALLMVIRMLRADVTRRRVVIAALAGTLAAGTRAPGVLLVAVCTVVLLVALWRRDGWRTAAVVAGVVGGVPALGTGWFYLRNLHLYGDLTGQSALLEKFGRSPVHGVEGVTHINGLWETVQATPLPMIALAVLAPLVAVAAWHRRSLRVRLDAVWVLLGVHAVVTSANIASFIRAGGGFHDRYFMPIMPLLATCAAVGMLEVGRWVRGEHTTRLEWKVATGWTVLLLAWLPISVTQLEMEHLFLPRTHHPGSPVLQATLLALGACAGLAVVASLALRGWDVPSPGTRQAHRRLPEEVTGGPLSKVPADRIS